MQSRNPLFGVVAVTLGTLLAAFVAEVTLRLAHFAPGRVNSGYLQFGYQEGIPSVDEDGVRSEGHPVRVRLFEPDPDLLWRPIANTEFTNSQGMRGKGEHQESKVPGTLRVAFLGDSCSFLGDPVFPEIVEKQLRERFPQRKVESLNFSSPGYSSFQGVRLLDRVRRWQPDAVVVYFGWNDHWPAQGGLTDTLQASVGSGLRIVGLIRAVYASRQSTPINRVPIDGYRTNLTTIRDAISQWGAIPVFVTAPTGFRGGAMPGWTYRFYGQFYHMDRATVDSLPAIHHQYTDVVRSVAASPPSVLVDTEADFAAINDSAAQLFRKDQIHLQPAGHERMAADLTEALATALARRQ
ncbi:MAG TPA: SGNH/GDSL hydrolase family protein [Candidatus Acidoferrales bacterium]|nr:SGNH/GDSL hydrolase family protein [Candidatus Acidoferrales bacterium]